MKISGKIVLPDKIVDAILTVNKGQIVKLQKYSPRIKIDLNFRKKGLYILPGLIEVHGHFREPGLKTKGDIPHETRAALAGGVTTTLDMPNTKPPTTTVKLLNQKINKIYKGRSYTDYSFFMGVGKDSLGEIKKVNKKNIVGIKVFMAGHETTPTTIPDDKTLAKVFEIAAKRNILVGVHAEDQSLINFYNKKFEKRKDPSVWSEKRPKEVVVSAVARAIALAQQFKTKLYLLHLSTSEEFVLVDAAKLRGESVYGELVGYQLIFTTKDYKRLGNKIKVAPALRDPKDQKDMWERLRSSQIDVLCSEHTPHEWKTKNQSDERKAQAGTPCIQENLTALITSYIKQFGERKIENFLQLVAKHAAERPSEILGLRKKGKLSVGKDADMTVVDLNSSWRVSKKDLFSKCGWSAYEGMKLTGRPIYTLLRGEIVYDHGKILGAPTGKQLT